MKDTTFLKEKYYTNRGIYNNKEVYENTLESFNYSINEGYGIHLSVHTTSDGILVIYHDDDLTRLMNLKDMIEMVTYDELNYLCSYHIPTIDEALNLIDGKVPIIINPRNQSNKYYLEKELAKKLDKYQGKFAIINDNACIIKWFNKNRPDYIIGEIISKNKNFNKLTIKNLIAHYSIVTDFKSVNIKYNNVRKIRSLRNDNLVLGYLVNSKETYQTFKDSCDNLFVDNIKELELS